MWGTTPLFLEKLGIASLDDLPSVASFVPDASLVEALEKTLRVSDDVVEDASDSDDQEEQSTQSESHN
jgi:segregation and condensation protein B